MNHGQEELRRPSERWHSSDKISTTGWQAHDGRGIACDCCAACLAMARGYMGRVSPRNALARNRGVRRWLWRYIFYDKSVAQHSNVCHRTAMAETQLPEYSGGSGLDNENGLPRGVPRVYELRLSTGAVERYRRESTCCGGWVILENCTAYAHLHVGFLTF